MDAVFKAREAGRPVIWMMGAHVIKCGLGPLLIDLIKKGVITHIAGNGAVSIHDMELALIGETSEDVAASIEDGSFGMAEETGAHIHKALKYGVYDGLGYGEALGRYIGENNFPHRDISVIYKAYELGVPVTIHVTMGADIIHQHPDCDFGIMGEATGIDFKVFCASVAKLDQGVFLNIGSAVTGAEVFLKAISIARNLGYPVSRFTTANFDIIPLAGDYHSKVSNTQPEYYYRPRKNIVNRPVSMGGYGFHIQGNHLETVPTFHHHAVSRLGEGINFSQPDEKSGDEKEIISQRIKSRSQAANSSFTELFKNHAHLLGNQVQLGKCYLTIASCLERGGTLFLAGNGGSMSDALHISGEMLKSYAIKRPLQEREKIEIAKQQDGTLLSSILEQGLRGITMWVNPALASAVENDFPERGLAIAQELNALAKPGDVFLGISTSGKARNITFAVEVAKAKGVTSILLTGPNRGKLSEIVDIAIHAPGERTDRIQENHILLYHCLCEMLELDFFRT
jgi:phosphoheptose isomerase